MLPVLLAVSVAFGASTKRKPDAERGKALYAEHCWMCHGKRALGDGPSRTVLGPPAPPLAGRVPVETWPAHVQVIQEGRGAMPGYAALLGREQSQCILNWLSGLDAETGMDPAGDKAPPKPPKRGGPDADADDDAEDTPDEAPDEAPDDAPAAKPKADADAADG